MTTQYTPILKLALPVQGELSGTWGDTVNDNITSMVEEAIAGRSVINSWTTNSHTLTTADGTTAESRAMMLEFTDTGVALTGAGTVICPAASKVYICKNSSGQVVTIKTSGGTGVAVPNGATTFVFCDGTNVEECVTNIVDVTVSGTITLASGVSVSAILDEDNMASNSATALATQQSIKAYVDSQVGTVDTLAEVLANGNTTGGTNIVVTAGDSITVDTIAETTAANGVVVDGVTLKDGGITVTADVAFGDNDKATFGASDDLQIYHDGSNTRITEAGTGSLLISADDLFLRNVAGNSYFQGISGGSSNIFHAGSVKLATTATGIDVTGEITADGIALGDNQKATFGASDDLQIYHSGSNSFIKDAGTGALILDTDGTQIILSANSVSEYMAIFNINGAANLYHNNSLKFQTTATGIDVTGTVTADGGLIGDAVSASLSQTGMLTVSDTNSANTWTNFTGTAAYLPFAHELAVVNLADATTNSFAGLYFMAGETSAASGISSARIGAVRTGASTADLAFSTRGGSDMNQAMRIAGNGDISFYEDTGTTAKLTWSATNEDLNFADNVKATFGASDDLQIYHDGSHSFISDQGTGRLYIQGTDGVRITNAEAGNMLSALSGDGVYAYFNAGLKLATTATGIDVTGTVTADGLTVDGDATVGGASGGKLSIAGQGIDAFATTTEPSIYRTGSGGSDIFSAAGHLVIQPRTNAARSVNIATSSDGVSTLKRASFADNGDISFYEDTGTTAKFFWDASAESLGIGTTSPASPIHVQKSTGSGGVAIAQFRDESPASGGNGLLVDVTNTPQTYVADFRIGNASKMRIDASGNLLVGTTDATPAQQASVTGISLRTTGAIETAADGGNAARFNRLTSDGNIVEFRKDGTTVGSIGSSSTTNQTYFAGTSRGVTFGSSTLYPCSNTGSGQDAQLDIGSGTYRFKNLYLSAAVRWYSGATQKAYMQYDGTDVVHYGASGVGHQFWSGGNRSVDIDSSGNLLVGKTSATATDLGAQIESDGQIKTTSNGQSALTLNRKTSDGSIAIFQKDGSTVGSISVASSTTSYNITSDQRLKDNIVDAPSASDDIDAIQVRSFDWKADGSHQKYGMVAQELMTVAPEAVSGDPDSDEIMGVDYSKLVPMMMKEIQSLRARVAQLEGVN